MQTVNITQTANTIIVDSPYDPEFVLQAKGLGGQWDSRRWSFDIRDAARVRDLCLHVFGSAGDAAEQTVSLRVTVKAGTSIQQGPLRLAGREIAAARGRDTGARHGVGVVLVAGRFGSGGSVKNWSTTCTKGATVIVRDMPAAMADRLIAGDRPDWVESIQIEQEAPLTDPTALRAERDRLIARLAEIDALIATAA